MFLYILNWQSFLKSTFTFISKIKLILDSRATNSITYLKIFESTLLFLFFWTGSSSITSRTVWRIWGGHSFQRRISKANSTKTSEKEEMIFDLLQGEQYWKLLKVLPSIVIYFLRSIFEFDTKFLWKYIIHQSYLNVKPGVIFIFFCFPSYFTPMISRTFGSISDLIWPIEGGLSTIRNSNGFSPISMAL